MQLFIIDKTENIILKEVEKPWDLYGNHIIVHILIYTKDRVSSYKEYVVVYQANEYNPKFLQLCDLFLSIAQQITP